MVQVSPVALSLADPSGPSTLVAAARWLEGTALGTLATAIAIICVAYVGLMMLTGRVNLRCGVTVTVGSFLVFGATSIAAGIRCAAQGGVCGANSFPPTQFETASSPLEPVRPFQPTAPATNDPYAGAALLPQ